MLRGLDPLPLRYRLLNRLITSIGGLRLSMLSLDKDKLLENASERTGLSDFGDSYFEEGLDQLLESVKQDVKQDFYNRLVIVKMIERNLRNRLLFVQKLKDHPIETRPKLKPPIIITGLARTGTTFLHRLVSSDKNNRGIPYWQCFEPFAPLKGEDFRRNRVTQMLEGNRILFNGLDGLHHLEADDPEECIFLLGITFHSPIYWINGPFLQYMAWLASRNMDKVYQEYRQMLELLQLEQPEKRLVLKTPWHMGYLDSLTKAVPEAMIIQTHRHPKDVCKSYLNLLYMLHNMLHRKSNPYLSARINFEGMVSGVMENIRFREKNSINVCDVHYSNLVDRPLQVVEDVYEYFSLPQYEQLNQELKSHIDESLRIKRTPPINDLENFKITKKEETTRFQEYVDKYAIAE